MTPIPPTAEDLRRAREGAGLTPAQLAERVGKSREYIRQVEQGKRPVTHAHVARVRAALAAIRDGAAQGVRVLEKILVDRHGTG